MSNIHTAGDLGELGYIVLNELQSISHFLAGSSILRSQSMKLSTFSMTNIPGHFDGCVELGHFEFTNKKGRA